jgi:hypothetical protein
MKLGLRATSVEQNAVRDYDIRRNNKVRYGTVGHAVRRFVRTSD